MKFKIKWWMWVILIWLVLGLFAYFTTSCPDKQLILRLIKGPLNFINGINYCGGPGWFT